MLDKLLHDVFPYVVSLRICIGSGCSDTALKSPDGRSIIPNIVSHSLTRANTESVLNELKVKEGDALEWERIIYEGKIAIRVKKAAKE